MNTETMTAEQLAAVLGERITSGYGPTASLKAAEIAETGGGCTATVLTFTADDGRVGSLVLMTTHSAIDGEAVANMYGDDGEFLVVGFYNVAELFEQTYDGSDPRDIHVSSFEALVNYCRSYVAEWLNADR